ncbi:MAG: hypothetical protein GY815_07380, partial [Gammaproteobacteria bacterium]|nr:hypothetical protein [Gammaproteobacteria bacterium]
NNDSDGDTLFDGDEVNTYQTDPSKKDTDDDELDDNVELNTYQTDPLLSDSDSDGMPDGWEVSYQLDPLIDDSALDPDVDGKTNLEEYQLGSNPNVIDVTEEAGNDSIADAQNIDRYFSLGYSADVGDENSNTSETIPYVSITGTGDYSYDYFEFTVTAENSLAIFDIDYGYGTEEGSFDTYLRIYDESGNLL